MLCILLDWVSEVNLKVAFDDRFYKPSGTKQANDKVDSEIQAIQEKCCKVTFCLVYLTAG